MGVGDEGYDKESQFRAHGLRANHAQAQRNIREEGSFADLGGAAVNEESFGRNWKFKVQRLLVG